MNKLTLFATALFVTIFISSYNIAVAQDSLADFNKLYIGKIDGKYSVAMYLKKNGEELTGSYKYSGQSDKLMLNGTIDPSGNFTMDESEFYGSKKITGIFSGKIVGTSITGEWRVSDSSRKMSFIAHEPSKKELLQNAAGGTYYLSSISGAWGANTLFDTWKEKGKWKSNGSAISAGMREGWENTLSNNDIKLLDSMYIKVDTNLTVRFFIGEKLMLEVPFNETGMNYNISEAHRNAINFDMGTLSQNTIFKDGKLYLAAIDNINYSDTLPESDFLMVTSDMALLSYDPSDTFELSIFISSCCDNNTLTFTKK